MSGPGSGLAIAILLAMICMVIGPALVLGLVGYAVARGRARKNGAGGTLALTLGGVVVGVLIGGAAVLLTFFESVFDPVVVFEVPPNFDKPEIFLLEDPSASLEFEWGTFGLRGSAPVPASGVVRVRTMGKLDHGPYTVELSTGQHNWGMASFPSPPGIPGPSVRCFSFREWTPGDTTCERRGEELVAHLRQLEGLGE
ncbi:MAG: hypothetical protein AAGE52_08075 [Myxococcota bacterium]